MTAQPHRKVTVDEYLAMEEASEERSELIRGQIVAMSGNRAPHLRVVRNLMRRLGEQLDGKECEVLCNELRVKVELMEDYFYPDIVGLCGTPQFETPAEVTLLNPVLLIEILSKSTEAYDRGAKFLSYQQIPSLKEYVLVSRTEIRVEIFRRNGDGTWKYETVVGADAVADFRSIECAVPLREIFRDVALDPADKPVDDREGLNS